MVYRIRYQTASGDGESEVVVEANSPNEALVKFRHACQANTPPAPESIISVCGVEQADAIPL